MSRRKSPASATAWRQSPEGLERYREARAAAQAQCNTDGFDRGIEFNDVFKTVRSFMLPDGKNRYGHELCCEVVMCENAARTQPGHGNEGRLALRARDAGCWNHYRSSTGR
jgi:hypothetical protein